jgi:hypothetical protein
VELVEAREGLALKVGSMVRLVRLGIPVPPMATTSTT